MFFKSRKLHSVRTAGDPVLSAIALPVKEVTAEIRELAAAMTETLDLFDGIGLAAPQVGVSLRLVVLGVPFPKEKNAVLSPGEKELLPRMPLVLVNPEITASTPEVSEHEEGCLSVPDIWATVVRPSGVHLRSQTLDGGIIDCDCGGLLARCIQHELDHLDGLLFTDRLNPAERQRIGGELERLIASGERTGFRRVRRK